MRQPHSLKEQKGNLTAFEGQKNPQATLLNWPTALKFQRKEMTWVLEINTCIKSSEFRGGEINLISEIDFEVWKQNRKSVSENRRDYLKHWAQFCGSLKLLTGSTLTSGDGQRRHTTEYSKRERGEHYFPSACACSVSSDSATPWIAAHKAPLSWDFPGKSTGVGCYFLLQGIFLTQRWNLCLLHWQADSLPPRHLGSSRFSRQEDWCGLPFPSPEDLPDPGVKRRSPELQTDSYELQGRS